MGASFYEESLKPENQNKLPVVKWVGSEAKTVGMGNTAIPKFELAAFKERPDNFIIPSWVSSEEGEAKSTFLPDEPSSDANTSTFVDDEIPF